MYYMDANKVYREKAKRELLKNVKSYIEQIREATSHKTAAVQSLKPSKLDGTLLEK